MPMRRTIGISLACLVTSSGVSAIAQAVAAALNLADKGNLFRNRLRVLPRLRLLGRQLRVDVTGNQPAALDLDLAVVDRSRDAPARLDQKPLLHDEIALEAAADLGFLDRGGALEQAGFGDTEIAAIRQVGLNAALDDSLSQDVISPDRMISRPTISFRTSATLRLG
jgi:hypothetical protein